MLYGRMVPTMDLAPDTVFADERIIVVNSADLPYLISKALKTPNAAQHMKAILVYEGERSKLFSI